MAEEYHPISLTCTACKPMEHKITSAITSHLEKNDILCPKHSFRHRRPSEMQLLGYIDKMTKELEKDNQEDTIVLNFSKASDKVSHILHVHQLYHCGSRGCFNAWTEGFLQDRKQAVDVVVDGAKYDFVPVDSSVPQGSVL